MRHAMILLALFALVACDDTAPPDAGTDAATSDAAPPDAGDLPLEPDQVCPGGDGCADTGDDALYAGAAAVTVTPSFDDVERLTVDVDGDGVFDPEDGDNYEDANGNGLYDAIWLAGFGYGRAATDILNDTWARALVLRQNETTIAFVAIDVVGFFLDDMDPIRELVADLDVDTVVISATHVHETRDTIGIWGRTIDETGRSPAYIAYIQQRAAQAVREAVTGLRRSHVQYASLLLRDQPGGVRRYVSDSRDPQVIDDQVRVMRFLEPTGETIATLVNYAAHPEYMGSSNTSLSSDFPHWLREGIEEGAVASDGTSLPGVGGVCVFVNGALGSQIGPNRVRLQTWAGDPVSRGTEAAQTMGSQVASFVLTALGPDGGSVTDETADLGFRRARFFVKIQNRRYHIAYLQDLFVREVYNWDMSHAIRAGNEPDVISEIEVIDVGRAQMITAPGELDPALFVGGYDGAYADGEPVVDTTQINPPDLSMAPSGPYLRDLARADADQVWLLGLTNDFLGYLIPEFDYVLDPGLPYIGEAPGDHYEETNSIGIDGSPRILGKLEELLTWTP